MSHRDLASLRGASSSPPAPSSGRSSSADLGGVDASPGVHASPSVGAFAARHADGVRFRDIRPDVGERYQRVVVEDVPLSRAEEAATARLREAVLLREKWVFRRARPEWEGEGRAEDGERGEGRKEKETTPAPPFDPHAPEMLPESGHRVEWVDGLACVFDAAGEPLQFARAGRKANYAEFSRDMETLASIVEDPEVRTFTWRRLKLNTEKFNMYSILNGDKESLAQKMYPHRDFFNCVKVDTQ